MTEPDTEPETQETSDDPTYFKDDLQTLAAETVRHLRKKLADGTATAADLSAGVGLLRDNRISATERPALEVGAEELDELEGCPSGLDELPPPPTHYYADYAGNAAADSQLRTAMRTSKKGLN
ncbi:MAG: hypothetical protein NXI30_04030 [bacterium]|nr:hypothetical protein [bacterium]